MTNCNGMIFKICYFLLIVKFCTGNDLGSLISGVTPVEEIKVDGDVVDSSSDKVHLERDEDGKLIVEYNGKDSLSVIRSTGISSSVSQEMLKIIRNALGSRYHLLMSLKRGGRLLTLKNERKLNEVIDSNKQKIELFLKGSPVDLAKATVIDTTEDSSVLEPEGASGVRIRISDQRVEVKTAGGDEVKIVVTKGINKQQVETLKENFYSIMAQKTSDITGLPKPLVELMISGRDTMVDRLSKVLSPAERVVIGGTIVNLDKSKRVDSSSGTILEPKSMPQVKIVWMKDDKLRVESGDGGSIFVEYSKGVEPRLIGKLVDGLHRALTLRVGMISWSNKLLGSIPPQLEAAIDEVKGKIQKRTILVEGKEVDLSTASVVKSTDESVVYRLSSGVLLTIHHDGTIATEKGVLLAQEITPGISETQAANLLSRMNQMFSTAISFSTEAGETLLNDQSNRKILQSLMRGIKPKEKVTVDDELVDFSNATVSKKESNYTEYSLENFSDVTLTKFSDGLIRVVGKGRSLTVSRSTGLSLGFLNRLVKAVNNVMPKKRWFYSFGNKGSNFRGQTLQTIIDEIPKMIQKQVVLVDGKEINILKASLISVDDDSTVYTPETNSKVKITKYANGDIQAATTGDEIVTVSVSNGITSQDAETLVSNIKKLVGDKFKVGPKRPDNFWCFSGDLRKLMGMLMNEISPRATILLNDKETPSIELLLNEKYSRTVDKNGSGNGFSIVDYKGRGKNISSSIGGKFSVALSTGLTEEISKDLTDYLLSLLDDNQDVIKMVTGSFPEQKNKKIKDMIHAMVQTNVVKVDAELITPSNSVLIEKKLNYNLYQHPDKNDFKMKVSKDGSIEIESSQNHKVSVAVSPGVTAEQARIIYRNVMSVFRTKFSDITNIPLPFLDFISGFKKYMMRSYFYSSAPPKEFVSVNGKEIRLKNMTEVENDSVFTLTEPDGMSGVTVSKYADGTLALTLSKGGNIDVIRTTGLDRSQMNRVLKAVEFKLGVTNKLFRMSSDELFSLPDKPESIETVLKSCTSTERIFIGGTEIDMGRSSKIHDHDRCSLFKSDDYPSLIVKRCEDGQVSVDTRGTETITLQILPGISVEQARYIMKSLMTTIQTKGSNIKLLANLPDIFLKLLANGRIKSLEEILHVLIPKESVLLDGKQMKLGPNEGFSPEQDYRVIESENIPGLQVFRFNNGTLEAKSWNGGSLDVTMNTGFSMKLLRLAIETLKDHTTENLGPYFYLLDEILNANATTVFNIIDEIIKFKNSGTNMTILMDRVQDEVKKRIKFKVNPTIIRDFAKNTVQKQTAFINDEEVDLDKASIVRSNDGFVVYSPENIDYVKITKYDTGRIVVDSDRDEPVALRITAGIPKKQLKSLVHSLERLFTKLDTSDDFVDRVKTQLTIYVGKLYEEATRSITPRRHIILDGKEMELVQEIVVEDRTYQKDDVLVTIDNADGTRVETSTAGKVELDISSGLISQPVVSYLVNNSLALAKELVHSYYHFETMVPLMTKMEKIVDGMLESLEQEVTIYINKKHINVSNMKVIKSTHELRILQSEDVPGLNITSYNCGRWVIELPSPGTSLEVYVSQGLSPGDLDKLSSNVELLYSSFNPLELVADIFDLLPKNYLMLAQNMDRVLSVMNMIKF